MKKFSEMIYYSPSFRAAQVKEEAFSLPPACASLKGRTLLFVSDVHLCRIFPIEAVRRLTEQMAQYNADMILLGGDYAESAEWQRQFFHELSRLHAPLGIYAVAGNNDSECFENIEELTEIAARAGVTFLNNRTAHVSVGVCRIAVAGMSDFKYGEETVHPLFEPADESAFRILLSHYPQGISHYVSHFSKLQPHLALSGHTHGGQFSVFGLTPYSIGFEHHFHGIKLPAVSGWTNVEHTKLLVSEGIGTSRLPFRLCVPPAFHLIRL